MTVAQRLTDAEILEVAQWVANLDAPEVSRIFSKPGYALNRADLASHSTATVQGAFRDHEWAGAGRSCLYCLNRRQAPTAAPHYRTHLPGCPVDIVCSGTIKSEPIDRSDVDDDGRMRLAYNGVHAAPFSGYVWSAEFDAWTPDPAVVARMREQAIMEEWAASAMDE